MQPACVAKDAFVQYAIKLFSISSSLVDVNGLSEYVI